MRVHLVRHGDVDNPEGLRYGRRAGFALSERGRESVARTAAWLASRQEVGVVMTSPLERAVETAEAIARASGAPAPIVDERLIEAGDWREGLPRAMRPLAIVARVVTPSEWVSHESPRAVALRMRAAVLDAIEAHESRGGRGDVAIVSHQTPLRLARLAFERGLGTPGAPRLVSWIPGAFSQYPCATASVTTLELVGRTLVRVSYEPAP